MRRLLMGFVMALVMAWGTTSCVESGPNADDATLSSQSALAQNDQPGTEAAAEPTADDIGCACKRGGQGRHFVDADGDGINDNFVDADGDGKCDVGGGDGKGNG